MTSGRPAAAVRAFGGGDVRPGQAQTSPRPDLLPRVPSVRARRPPPAIIQRIHDGGFRWRPEDKMRVFTIGNDSAARDRLHGEDTFDAITNLIRRGRGITHSFGGGPLDKLPRPARTRA